MVASPRQKMDGSGGRSRAANTTAASARRKPLLHRASIESRRSCPIFGAESFSGDVMGVTAQPSATPGTSSFLNDVLDVFNVLHDPLAVFNRIKQRPRILAPWLVLSAFFIISAILTRPYQQAAFEAFKASLTPEQIARMGNRGSGGGVMGLVLTPVIALAGLAICGGALSIGGALTGTQARFKTILSGLLTKQ